MKKSILIAGVLALFNTTFVNALSLNDIQGSWKGIGIQESGSSWTVNLSISGRDNSLNVKYPSLRCGGVWESKKIVGNTIYAVERLTYGKSKCLGGSKLELTKVNDYALFVRMASRGSRTSAVIVLQNEF